MQSLRCEVFFLIAFMAAASLPAYGAGAAKDYPARTIRFVVPYAAGGGVDVVGRIIGQKMTPGLGQNIVLDNRGGAGGVIGTDVVAKAAPDGYSLLLTSSSYASLPYFVKNLPYDPVHDLLPVTMIAKNVGHVLAVNLNVRAHSLKELIALAKAQPGKLNYVHRIQAEVEKAVKDPDVRRKYEEQGLEVVGSKPAEFEKAIQQEFAFNKKLTTAIGIVPQ